MAERPHKKMSKKKAMKADAEKERNDSKTMTPLRSMEEYHNILRLRQVLIFQLTQKNIADGVGEGGKVRNHREHVVYSHRKSAIR